MLLGDARHEARNVNQGDQRDVKGIAEADELCALVRGIDVQHTGHHVRLVGDKAHGTAQNSTKADNQVGGKTRLALEEVAIVGDTDDDLADVVALLAIDGNDVAELWIRLGVEYRIHDWRLFRVVLWQEA